MTNVSHFRGYELFNDIEDRALQAYNRAMVARNISEASGDAAVKEYIELIPESEQVLVIQALQKIAGFTS